MDAITGIFLIFLLLMFLIKLYFFYIYTYIQIINDINETRPTVISKRSALEQYIYIYNKANEMIVFDKRNEISMRFSVIIKPKKIIVCENVALDRIIKHISKGTQLKEKLLPSAIRHMIFRNFLMGDMYLDSSLHDFTNLISSSQKYFSRWIESYKASTHEEV